jgi:hypothetical protein
MTIDTTQQVIGRHVIVEIERLKQAALLAPP